ncbi:MAG TPA: SDR family oxidoreductase [Schlesneria sp.]|jgi:3-oxoacyl-[acyl-carrier protein] reductase
MDLQLAGKVGIVTGASRGIGRAIAQSLAAEGMRLVLVARSGEQLAELAKSLPTASLVHVADLRQEDAAEELLVATIEQFGQLDLLVNNAGATVRGDFLKLTDAEWDDGFALKFFGAMRCCRAAWPYLQQSQGSIVNIVGIGGRTGSAEFAIGGSVNAAVLNLTKVLADRGINDGVRVNAINPGAIATDRLQTRIDRAASDQGVDKETAAAQLAREMKIARFGMPTEIGDAVAFLASARAAYCQGAIIDIDGGQTRTL